jgi:hypothetical protein
MMPPPPPDRHCPPEGESIGPDFLESLKKIPALYDLSRSQLEELVAQVVREDGFAKLVRIDAKRYLFSYLI